MNSEEEWQRLHPTLTIKVKNALKVLIENYNVIYGDGEKINEVCEEFGIQLKQCCDNVVNKSENDKQQMISDVENLYKDYIKLSKELKIDNDIDFPDSTPLLEILNTLQEKVTELLRIRTERLEIYEQLKDKERSLCAVLRENEISEASGIPSSPYLNKLRSQVNKLENSKNHLDNEIQSLRKKAEEIMNKLAIRPILSVELFCFDGTSTSIKFSKDTHEELLKLIEKLEEEQVNMMEEANRLRETLSIMWNRINESYTTREEILSKCNGFSRDQIAMLKEELKRCEEIKRKNLSYYINCVKQELNDWWEKCYYSEEEKNNFKPFHETFCSEDLLQILELEVENLKSLYNRYEDIYGLIERRNILWERLKRLMVSAKDPDRLFNNRGGALLREEKERKNLQKELPKIEKILKSKLTVFEEEQSRPFTMNGQVVWNIIEDDWNEFHSKKDEEKYARKVANMNTLAVESRLGTNVAAGVKRKAPTSARAQPTATTATKYKTPAQKKPRNVPAPCTVALMSSQRDLPYALMTPSNMSTSSSYSLFQEHLDGRNDTQQTPCRSTLTSGNILKPRNTPLPAHSSPKTPKTPFYRTRNNTMSTNKKNAQHKSPFKVGSSTKIPTLTVPTKSPRVGTSQLKTPRRNLPIII